MRVNYRYRLEPADARVILRGGHTPVRAEPVEAQAGEEQVLKGQWSCPAPDCPECVEGQAQGERDSGQAGRIL